MIKTKYTVTVVVDDKEYKIIVSEPNKDQKEQMLALVGNQEKEREEYDSLSLTLNELENEFEINKTIIAHGSITEKMSVCFDQKKLNKQIASSKKDLAEKRKGLASIETVLEDAFKNRFNLLVSGEGKAELLKVIEESGISYNTVWMALGEEIKKSKEKK